MPKAFSEGRRRFFTRAAALGGSAVLLALGRKEGPAQEPAAPTPKPAGSGYRLTEHVAKYYEKARG